MNAMPCDALWVIDHLRTAWVVAITDLSACVQCNELIPRYLSGLLYLLLPFPKPVSPKTRNAYVYSGTREREHVSPFDAATRCVPYELANIPDALVRVAACCVKSPTPQKNARRQPSS